MRPRSAIRLQSTGHIARAGIWDDGVTRPRRTLDAVTLETKLKDELVADIKAYLEQKTRKYYSNRGIPWRRGFLFHGPPGTGKTSFTTALAGHFKLDVYVMSLSATTLDDQRLQSLFGNLPTRWIILLEDIDSVGIQREEMRTTAKKKGKKPKKLDENGDPVGDDPSGITLSGLLNVLDGVHSVEGRIVILTTNKPDTLDDALCLSLIHI